MQTMYLIQFSNFETYYSYTLGRNQ